MQEIVLKCYGKLKIFLGKKTYDLASPPLSNTFRGPCPKADLHDTSRMRFLSWCI